MARMGPFEVIHHGHSVSDNYHWLEDSGAPEVIAYLEAVEASDDPLVRIGFLRELAQLIESGQGEAIDSL